MDVVKKIKAGENESHKLEYKSKRSNNKDIAKELVALANADGGILVVGIKESDGEIEDIQNMGEISEKEEGIQNVNSSSVKPPIKIDYESIEVDGKKLVSFNVEDSSLLHSFKENKPVFPVRQGTTTRYIDGYEIYRRFTGEDIEMANNEEDIDNRFDRTIKQSWVEGVARFGSHKEVTDVSPPIFSAPEKRMIIKVKERNIVVPTEIGIDPVSFDALIYHVESRLDIESNKDLKEVIEGILDTGVSNRDLSYVISYGQRELIGRHKENLFSDIDDIYDVIEILNPGAGFPDDPRPICIICFPFLNGLGWIQLQWQNNVLRRGRSKSGLILPHIPIDIEPIEGFFEKTKRPPFEFKQKSQLQFLKVHANVKDTLSNPSPINLKSKLSDSYVEVAADNPFYDNKTVFNDAFDMEIPQHFQEALSSINRLPFDVGGGWMSEDEGFDFHLMEILVKDLIFPTYFINPMCFPSKNSQ